MAGNGPVPMVHTQVEGVWDVWTIGTGADHWYSTRTIGTGADHWYSTRTIGTGADHWYSTRTIIDTLIKTIGTLPVLSSCQLR